MFYIITNKNNLVFTVCRHRLAVCNVTLQLHILAHNKNTDSLVAMIVSCLSTYIVCNHGAMALSMFRKRIFFIISSI